jgi:hypothetical protein
MLCKFKHQSFDVYELIAKKGHNETKKEFFWAQLKTLELIVAKLKPS